MERSSAVGLLAGLVTVALWASLPLLRAFVHLPPMLTASIAMLAAAGVAQVLARGRYPRQAPAPIDDARFWIMGIGGLTGALYFYFLALGKGDPAKVTLVTYTWPVGFMLVADGLAGHGLRIRTLLGALVAFSGLAPLILASGDSLPTPPLAYGAGLAAGVSWIVFSLYLKTGSGSQSPDYPRIFGGVAATALCLHLLFEPAVEKSTYGDWLMAVLIGVGPYGLAFMTWGYALLRCSTGLLGILTYLVPVISSLLIVLLGRASFSTSLTIALIAIFASGAITQGLLPSRSALWKTLLPRCWLIRERAILAEEHEPSPHQHRDAFPPILMPAMPPLGLLVWFRNLSASNHPPETTGE